MEHPDLNFLIQKSIQEDRIRTATIMRRTPAVNPVKRLRFATGNALMNIGARIAATPRPVNPQPTMGKVSIAGSARNS